MGLVKFNLLIICVLAFASSSLEAAEAQSKAARPKYKASDLAKHQANCRKLCPVWYESIFKESSETLTCVCLYDQGKADTEQSLLKANEERMLKNNLPPPDPKIDDPELLQYEVLRIQMGTMTEGYL